VARYSPYRHTGFFTSDATVCTAVAGVVTHRPRIGKGEHEPIREPGMERPTGSSKREPLVRRGISLKLESF